MHAAIRWTALTCSLAFCACDRAGPPTGAASPAGGVASRAVTPPPTDHGAPAGYGVTAQVYAYNVIIEDASAPVEPAR